MFRKPGTHAPAVEYDAPGSTNEEIHPTVGYRYKMFKKLARYKNPIKKLDDDNPLLYHPAELSGEQNFNRTWNAKDGRWGYKFPENVRSSRMDSKGLQWHMKTLCGGTQAVSFGRGKLCSNT
jgi:hypothetical protein